jgi:hypothetical protein
MSSSIQVPRFRLESRCSHRRRVVVAVVAIVVRGGGDLGGTASLGEERKYDPLEVRPLVGPPPKRLIRSTRCPGPRIFHARSPPRHPKRTSPNGFCAKPPPSRATKILLGPAEEPQNTVLLRRTRAMPPDDNIWQEGAPNPPGGSHALIPTPTAPRTTASELYVLNPSFDV